MKKTKIHMNKPLYLGQAMLDISKTLMYEFWYDYLKQKCNDKVKLCYMDTDSFIIHVQTEDFYKDITKDVHKCFDTSDFNKKQNDLFSTVINKKVLYTFKSELNGKIMTEFAASGAKVYAPKKGSDQDTKKAKGTKKCVIKNNLTFEVIRILHSLTKQ